MCFPALRAGNFIAALGAAGWTGREDTRLPKIKTHKATAKRFKVRASGLVVREKGGSSHLRRRKSKRAKRQFNEYLNVEELASAKRVKRLAPYLKKQK